MPEGKLTFIYMNPTDPNDPKNDTLMISGVELQGSNGLDPDCVTLQTDLFTHLEPTTVTSLSAGSIGMGSGGSGELRQYIRVERSRLCQRGLEATTATVAGVGTIGALTVSQDITCAHSTTTNILANKNLTLGQDGDTSGGTRLHLRTRSGDHGAIFETTHPTVTLVDLVFNHANGEGAQARGQSQLEPVTRRKHLETGRTRSLVARASDRGQSSKLPSTVKPGRAHMLGQFGLQRADSHVKWPGKSRPIQRLRSHQPQIKPTHQYRAVLPSLAT